MTFACNVYYVGTYLVSMDTLLSRTSVYSSPNSVIIGYSIAWWVCAERNCYILGILDEPLTEQKQMSLFICFDGYTGSLVDIAFVVLLP